MISVSNLAYTDEIDQIRERYNRINSEKEGYKEKLDGNSLLLEKARSEVAEIDAQISDLNSQLREVEARILEAKQNSKKVEQELISSKEELLNQQSALGGRLSAMYKNSEISYIEVILGSRDLIDLFDRINMVKNIVAYDRDVVEEVRSQKEKLEELTEALEREEEQYKSSARELEQKKLSFHNLSQSKEAILQGLRENQLEYEVKVANLSQESEDAKNEINRLELEAQQRNQQAEQVAGNLNVPSATSSSTSSSRGPIIAVGNQQGNPNVLTPFNSNIREYPASSGRYYEGRIPNIDFSHSRKRGPISVRATAYDPSPEQNGGYGGITATGTALRPGVIAVDPSVIALGSRVYIEYPDGSEMGYFVAEDTGGAIKGNRIDILFMRNTEARQFGVRNMNVYILE